MSKYVLGAFFLLYGLTTILKTEIPIWVLGVVAIACGLVLIAEAIRGKV